MTVYISQGYTTRNMTFFRDREQESDFEAVYDYVLHPDNVNTTDLEQYKANTATYLMAGTLEPKVRNDNNFKAASLLFVDFDHIPDEAKFLEGVKSKLNSFQYLLYPSISYGQAGKGARYHLILNLSHPLQQQEHDRKLTKAPLTGYVCDLLGMTPDTAMNTWSQLFGAPTLTPANKGKGFVNLDGEPLDVDKVIANYKPATKTPAVVAGKSQAPAIAHKQVKLLPDSYVHELLSKWVFEHPEEVATEEKFSTQLILVLNAQRAGEISPEALEDAMSVFAQDNTEWTIGNVQKLAEHQHSSEEPNDGSFRGLFHTTVPVYLRASEDATYTQESVELALARAGKAKLKANKEKANNRKASLSYADIADILVECIPMFARWHDMPDKSSPLIQIYNPKTGIYTASQAYFNSLVSLVDRDANSHCYKEVYSKLLDGKRVRDTQGLESGDMIATSNVIIDLSQEPAERHEFSPRYHFTSKIATEFHDIYTRPIPKFTTCTGEPITPVSLLQTICESNPAKIKQLLEVIGDACQPMKTRNQATWLLGKQSSTRQNGSNGKSTFLDIVQAVVGQANVATLTIDQMAGQFSMAQVVGKSVIIGDDVQAGVYVKDTANYNSLTTGGAIKVESKGEDAYSYRSCAGVIQATNQLPKIANQTGGTNRRMHVIVFDAHIPADKADARIRSEFIPSKPFREFVLYLAIGTIKGNSQFTETSESRDAVEQFAKGNDTVSLFVDEVASDWTSTRVPTQWAYDKYVEYVKDNNFQHSKSKPEFIKSMCAGLGYTEKKKSSVSGTNFDDFKTWIAFTKNSRNGINCLECPMKQPVEAKA
jgi:putative DNA primase/helicase